MIQALQFTWHNQCGSGITNTAVVVTLIVCAALIVILLGLDRWLNR